MPLPITLAVTYLAINLAMMLWLESERANGREPSRSVSGLSIALRFGPPLLGVIYLEVIAGDWVFLGLVAAFFIASFWLLDGLLTTTVPRRGSEAMRSGWDERTISRPSRADQDGP
jgi:hypothetical protein